MLNANVRQLLTSDAIPATIEAAEGKPTRVNILAYSGGFCRLAALPLPVVFDLSSTKSAPNVVMLYAHNREKPLGHFDSINISKRDINLGGVFSHDNEYTREIKAAHANGYPWQASVGLQSDDIEYIPGDKSVSVNGQKFQGPCYVARANTLLETSILTIGADSNTAVTLSATLGDIMNFSAWLKSLNYDESTLTAAQRTQLEATYNAYMAAGANAEAGTIAASAARTIMAAAAPPVVPPTTPPNPTPLNAGGGNGTLSIEAEMQRLRDAHAAERVRIDRINSLAMQYGNPVVNGVNIAASAIQTGLTIEAAELAMFRAARPTNIHAGASRSDGVTPWQLLEAGLAQSGRLPSPERHFTPQILDAAHRQYHSRLGLQEMLLEAARINGYTGSSNVKSNLRGILQAAFSTIEIVGILSNVSNKHLIDGYNAVDQTWRLISKITSASDFKEFTGYRGIGSFTFEEIASNGMIPHGRITEESYTNRVKTYAKMFAISRQDIYNDDLNMFSDVPRQLGRGGAIKFNKVFWTEFLDNTGSFFVAGNNNVSTGVLGIAGLNTACGVFMQLKDANGDYIMANPKYLLVPGVLMPTANSLYGDQHIVNGSTTSLPSGNPWAGKLIPITSPYLQDSTITGNSSAAYYLLADPNDVPVIDSAFLEGKQIPTVESADVDFNQLGVQMRGFWDFGVKKLDYRGGVRSVGA